MANNETAWMVTAIIFIVLFVLMAAIVIALIVLRFKRVRAAQDRIIQQELEAQKRHRAHIWYGGTPAVQQHHDHNQHRHHHHNHYQHQQQQQKIGATYM